MSPIGWRAWCSQEPPAHYELLGGKLRGIEKLGREFIPEASPPNVFIGGPVPVSSGFPIEAFGNDGRGSKEQPPPRAPACQGAGRQRARRER